MKTVEVRVIPCTFNICARCDSPWGEIERRVIAFLYFTEGGDFFPVIFDPERGAVPANSLGEGLKGFVLYD